MALPGKAEPEAAIVFGAANEADDADELIGFLRETQAPVPGLAALDLRQGDIAQVLESAVGRVRPRDAIEQVADDLPVGEVLLHLRGIGDLERAQDESRGAAFGNHGS